MRNRDDLRQSSIGGAAAVVVDDGNPPTVAAAVGTVRRATAVQRESSIPAPPLNGRGLPCASCGRRHVDTVRMLASGGAPRGMTWFGSDVIVRHIAGPAIDALPRQR